MTELIPIILPTDQQEGTLAALGTWLVKTGEQVRKHQPLLEVNTDKVSLEISAPVDGIVEEMLKSEGEEITPGEVLCHLRPATAQPTEAESGRANSNRSPAPTAPALRETPRGADASAADRLSPAVRRALKKHRISVDQITGSGRGGRITFQNVQDFLKERSSTPPETVHRPIPAGGSRKIPHTPMRLAIARHMVESQHTAPHVTAVFEVNFHALLSHYRGQKKDFAEGGIRLTLTSYMLAAAAHALQAVPEVNSRWHDDALEIFSDCNVGIATALGTGGVVVPVVRKAQDLSLFGIASQLQELTERARKGRLSLADMENGTLTITNHGVSGSLIATPIINQPQTAILGAGKIEKRIRVAEGPDGDSIQIRPMAYITLTIDHRALDGFTANRFLTHFCHHLENWNADTLQVR